MTSKQSRNDWLSKQYIRKMDVTPLIEVGLGLWFTVAVGVVFVHGWSAFASLPFLLLFQCGFLYVGLLSLLQTSRWLRALIHRPTDPT